MHELSLIQELLDMVKQSAIENGITRVDRVRLVVGESYGALPEALAFAFEVLAEGTVCHGAALDIVDSPLLFKCRECGTEFKPGEYSYRCPDCSASNAEPVGGRELYVDYYEGD
ncbi:hydrogenase maturation nickel metallochaperone HypA [Desulfoscipio geothermicus]|uniref:Hydrogenase maturation factor HypA n=1 Tax=Desulfoscipio geothermicus DSM 3669 TaxID=1121426 RepID=A0A1I6E7T3_9FIRM|nr:hydrogenase maturation nickel metallochaperone HypA [Desulfoscipio geothermicus]SFR13632.1 hydrogenase nickel incorporation protein HypA/HybF [Desulfoscipio geothermicus DSM 3669]